MYDYRKVSYKKSPPSTKAELCKFYVVKLSIKTKQGKSNPKEYWQEN